MRVFLLIGLVAISPWLAAGVYTCTDENGSSVFSQRPCGDEKKEVEVKYHQPAQSAAAVVATPEMPAPTSTSEASSSGSYAAIRNAKLVAYNQKNKIKKVQRELDKKIDALKQKKKRALNNLAGATWEESISKEMDAISAQYESKLTTERKKLEQLEDELAALNP